MRYSPLPGTWFLNTIIAGWLLGLSLLPGAWLEAQTSDERIGRLVAELGSESFDQRQAAEKELLEIGIPALASLQQAARWQGHQDHEIQLAAARLIKLLSEKRADLLVSQFFDSGQLPGWGQFQRTFGDTADNRKLYAQIYLSATALIDGLESGTADREQLMLPISAHARQISSEPEQALTSLLAAIWVANTGHLDRPLNDEQIVVINGLLIRQTTIKFLQKSEHHETLIRIVLRWLESQPDRQPLVNQQVRVMSDLADPHFFPLLAKLALDSTRPSAMRAVALAAIGNHARQDVTELVAPLLQDATPVGLFLQAVPDQADWDASRRSRNGLEIMEVRLQDLGLLACLRGSGRNPQDFGFMEDVVDDNQIAIPRAGFFNDSMRQAAMAQWSTRSEL